MTNALEDLDRAEVAVTEAEATVKRIKDTVAEYENAARGADTEREALEAALLEAIAQVALKEIEPAELAMLRDEHDRACRKFADMSDGARAVLGRLPPAEKALTAARENRKAVRSRVMRPVYDRLAAEVLALRRQEARIQQAWGRLAKASALPADGHSHFQHGESKSGLDGVTRSEGINPETFGPTSAFTPMTYDELRAQLVAHSEDSNNA